MENPLNRDVMIAVEKKHLMLVCETMLLGIKYQADQWCENIVGSGYKNEQTCEKIHALSRLLCQVHNNLRKNPDKYSQY